MKPCEVKPPSSPILAHFRRASKAPSPLDNLIAIIEQGAARGG
jgi:hypothetical protein